MKRRKGRLILGTTAVAAALALGGCAGGAKPSAETGSSTSVTASEAQTADTASEAQTADTASEAQTADTALEAQTADTAAEAQTGEKPHDEANEGETDKDFEVFDPLDNYNVVVYGPPKED